jgi:CheY-like chemotaxis protein
MQRVLVVDDDVVVANVIARGLRGYLVDIAHNGPEALAIAAQGPPYDLLITDYLMPAMSGDELAGRLHARQPAVKTLLVTGHGKFVDLHDGATDARLEKPVHLGRLRSTVQGLIGPAQS